MNYHLKLRISRQVRSFDNIVYYYYCLLVSKISKHGDTMYKYMFQTGLFCHALVCGEFQQTCRFAPQIKNTIRLFMNTMSGY